MVSEQGSDWTVTARLGLHADRTLCFGEKLSEAQRKYIAVLLIRKARECSIPTSERR